MLAAKTDLLTLKIHIRCKENIWLSVSSLFTPQQRQTSSSIKLYRLYIPKTLRKNSLKQQVKGSQTYLKAVLFFHMVTSRCTVWHPGKVATPKEQETVHEIPLRWAPCFRKSQPDCFLYGTKWYDQSDWFKCVQTNQWRFYMTSLVDSTKILIGK